MNRMQQKEKQKRNHPAVRKSSLGLETLGYLFIEIASASSKSEKSVPAFIGRILWKFIPGVKTGGNRGNWATEEAQHTDEIQHK